MPELYSVAIDGPSGAGKSTLAKAAAAALGICYVDTGAIYRTIGYGVYRRGIDPSDAGAVAAVLPDMQLEMRYDQAGLQRMMLAGEDVTDQIRLPEMSRYASTVSAIPAVRDFLLELQREQARRHSVFMDGRDNGTVVLSLWTPETGYMVELQHANNLLSVYKGLSQSLVTTGQTIRAGEMVGYNAEAEEGEVRLFEFELWNNGKPVDPEGYIVF